MRTDRRRARGGAGEDAAGSASTSDADTGSSHGTGGAGWVNWIWCSFAGTRSCSAR